MATEGNTMTNEGLERVVGDLRALSEDMRSLAVLSADGSLRSSSHAPGVDRERAGAMLAALSNLAERAARENGKSHVSQVRVKTEEGFLLLVALEGGGALAATTGPEARVGLVLYDMRNARGEVQKALGEGR
ncbi:MAG TPA: roadblock/LC7 domain-containing protein [Rubrobacteraceae bacterium]|nr:roadblock/LC7 domain-containing protein [Rubrobacteraceae bacterium]